MAAMTRDIEASAQFASKVWLHSFLLAERRVEVLLGAAAATAESFDGSRAGVGYPPALLFALGLRRDAFEEQCRACLELGWLGARLAAQQRAAFARAAAAGLQALSAVAYQGLAAPELRDDALGRERADERPGRRVRRKPASRPALVASSSPGPKGGRAAAGVAPGAALEPVAARGSAQSAPSPRNWPAASGRPRKPRPSVVLRSVSLVPPGSERDGDEAETPAYRADDNLSAAGGGRNG